MLSGDDARKAEELDKAVEASLAADRWDEAIAKAEELAALRAKVQGPKHFETVNAQWRLRALRRVAPARNEDRLAFRSASTIRYQADSYVAQGRYAAAAPLLEKLLSIRRRLLTDDHPDTAQSYNNLAYNLSAQGKYAQAQPLFEKALAICRRLLADDHPDTAASFNNLASNLDAQGKYAQAQPLYEKALEIRRRLFTDDHPVTAGSYNTVADNLNSQGKYAQAQPLYEKSLAICRRLLTDDHPQTATGYNNLAHNLKAQGKYAEAQPPYEKALAIRRRLLSDDHPDTAGSYNNLALNLVAQRRYAQAQPLFEKALEISRRLLGDDHPHTATSYDNLASNFDAQGKYAEARPLHEKALEIRRRLLSDDHPDTAQSYNNVALSLDAQGKYREAQPLHEKALEICRRLLTDEHSDTAASYNNLASNLDHQGKYAQAQPLHEKALDIRRRLLTEDHPDTAQSYKNLAANQNAQGKYAEARDRWQSAVRSLDAARLGIGFTGPERPGPAPSERIALAAVLARLGESTQAWQRLEEDLGRGMLDSLAARADRRLAPLERARLRELTTALDRLDQVVESKPKDLDQPDRAKQFDDLRRQRELASIALGEFQAKLVREHGPLVGQARTLNEIQSALSADAALVAWVDIAPLGPNAADPDGEHWGVVVRSRGVPVWVALAGSGPRGLWTEDDANFAARVTAELRRRPAAGAADLRPLLERLRKERLEPLLGTLRASADDLPPVRRLIVLPTEPMAGIPVEALLAPEDTRTVSYAPSATVLSYLREQPRPDRLAGLLAVGDAVSERPAARYEVEAIARLSRPDGRPTQILLGASASEPELERLATAGDLGRFGFIHIAAHGVIDQDVPGRSAVILSQTGLPDPLKQALSHQPVFDGRLTVREIQRTWELKAELVTLSACEKALGREAGGEGFVGFTPALLTSGARSVCLPLWKVDDTATALLMERFYANLLGGRPGLSRPLPKAEALAEAKTWLRGLGAAEATRRAADLAAAEPGPKTPRSATAADAPLPAPAHPYDHPYYWAAFVLVGDPD
jgi:CHAT domain-containing protein/tetratricopeptide (TPR) repeat protein